MTVAKVENHGSFQIAQLIFGVHSLVAKVDSDVSIEVGQKRPFHFASERTFLFRDKKAVSTVDTGSTKESR
jgi:ABC-type sugar transport system ATPase subunit